MRRRIVEHYKRQLRPLAERELSWFRDQPDFKSAVTKASRAINSAGRRYSHQCRIRRKAMAHAIRALRKAVAKLEAAVTFDELIQKVADIAATIPGIGDLYVYDTALRIGAHLGLAPTRVYLHAGTRTGAFQLGIGTRGRAYLEVAEVLAVAPEFEELTAGEMEDVFCIYKDQLQARKAGTAKFEPPGDSWCC